jgi:hypothetical protein
VIGNSRRWENQLNRSGARRRTFGGRRCVAAGSTSLGIAFVEVIDEFRSGPSQWTMGWIEWRLRYGAEMEECEDHASVEQDRDNLGFAGFHAAPCAR